MACHWPTLRGRPGASFFEGMGPGPARPTKNPEDWPKADPVHKNVKHFRPGPAHDLFRSLGPAWPFAWQRGPSDKGFIWASRIIFMGRPVDVMNGPAHVLSRAKRCMTARRREFRTLFVAFSFLFLVCWVQRDTCIWPMGIPLTSTHYSPTLLTQLCSIKDSVGWLASLL